MAKKKRVTEGNGEQAAKKTKGECFATIVWDDDSDANYDN
jgi:hypothetical protein